MGLDMYLYSEHYLGGYDWNKDKKEKEQFAKVTEALGVGGLVDEGSKHVTVSVCVGYWRKANAIHNWFVQNVQNGTDDCGHYETDRETLKTLRDTCQKVLDSIKTVPGKIHSSTEWGPDGKVEHYVDGLVVEDSTVAEKLLPTKSGFFFGGTAYDEDYIEGDLKYTIEMLDKVLAEVPEGVWFKYHSSW